MDGFVHLRELDHLVDNLWNHLLVEDKAKELAVFSNVPLLHTTDLIEVNGEGTVFVGERIVHSCFGSEDQKRKASQSWSSIATTAVGSSSK